ncbi:MAG: YncE family protein [Candidatus Limnocylindria bacterium]
MSATRRLLAPAATFSILVAACGGTAASPSSATATPAPSPAPLYELWIADQGESSPAGGGTLHIYRPDDLARAEPKPGYTANLAEVALGVGDGVGKHPHSITFNPTMTHAVISYVTSGHVQVVRAADRKVVASFKFPGTPAGAAQAHASGVTPANDAIIVANQGARKLQRIKADFANDKYALDPAGDIDLAAIEGASHTGNLPVIPVFSKDGKYMYVPQRGGGSYTIDHTTTPMKVIGTVGKGDIGPQSCCATFVGNAVWTTAQGGTTATTTSFNLYKVTGLPSTPSAKKILSRTGSVESHGVLLVGGRYLWVVDRFANTLDIFDTSTEASEPVRSLSLASGALAGRDPAPDIMDIAPDGKTVFLTLRGKSPVTSNIKDLNNSVGDVGGFAIISVKDDGRDAAVTAAVPLPLSAGASVVDPHGLRVRLIK